MSLKLRRLSGSLLIASVLELMLFFPIVLAEYVWMPPGTLSLAADALLLLVLYWLGYGINALLKFKHPFPKILLAVLVSGACGIVLLGVSSWSIILMLLGVFAVYRGTRLPGAPLGMRLMSQDFIIGVIFYFVVAVVNNVNGEFDDYRTVFLIAGVLTLFAALFLTNRNMVGRETLSGAERPMVEPSVRRNNRIFVGFAMMVTVLISLAIQLQQALSDAFHSVLTWLMDLLKYHGAQRDVPKEQVKPIENFMPPADSAPKNWAWLDYTMYTIAAIIAIALLYVLARRLNRLPGWLKELRKRFVAMFKRDKGVAARGYVDEIERIRKKEGSFRRLFGRSKEERLKWKDLNDNESRVRYLYRRWIGNAVKKGFAHQPHLTPQEIQRKLDGERIEHVSPAVTESLIRHYQQVRYGAGKLSDEELQKLAAQLGQVKS